MATFESFTGIYTAPVADNLHFQSHQRISSLSSHSRPSLLFPSSSSSSIRRRRFHAFPSRLSFSITASQAPLTGEEPSWQEDDYIVVGLAHCFEQKDGGKISDVFLVEPVSASSLECMENGGATCYRYVTATTLGTALKFDLSLLPKEFSEGRFCNDFDFRAKCAARTWKRPHAVSNLMHLAPSGSVRSDFNFSLTDKRVINMVHVVTDADNIKQDLSIDVYGRKKEGEEEAAVEVASLYNA